MPSCYCIIRHPCMHNRYNTALCPFSSFCPFFFLWSSLLVSHLPQPTRKLTTKNSGSQMSVLEGSLFAAPSGSSSSEEPKSQQRSGRTNCHGRHEALLLNLPVWPSGLGYAHHSTDLYGLPNAQTWGAHFMNQATAFKASREKAPSTCLDEESPCA